MTGHFPNFAGEENERHPHARRSSRLTRRSASASAVLASLRPAWRFWNSGQKPSFTPAVVARAASCRTSGRCARAASQHLEGEWVVLLDTRASCALSTALLPVSTLAILAKSLATSTSVRILHEVPRRDRDSSGLREDRARAVGRRPVAPWHLRPPSVSALWSLPLIRNRPGAWACSMPTLPVARLRSRTSGPRDRVDGALRRFSHLGHDLGGLGVLKVAFLRSGDSGSTSFMRMNGQYSQSKLSVNGPSSRRP